MKNAASPRSVPVSRPKFYCHIAENANPNSRQLSIDLTALVNRSDGLVDNIIVHGSAGDHSSIDFSDLDATILIADEVASSVDRLVQLRRYLRRHALPFLYANDPLQHHGYFLLWPQLCANYDEAILPPIVYDESWAVKPLDLQINSLCNSSQGRLIHMLKSCEHRIRVVGRWNPYTLKRLLSHLLIIPSLYFTESGCSMPKKQAFQPFIKVYEDYRPIYEFASSQRLQWGKRAIGLNEYVARFGYSIMRERFTRLLAQFQPRVQLTVADREVLQANLQRLIEKIELDEDSQLTSI